MLDPAAVLPPNATPLEQAMARVSARLLDIPVPIRDLWDADTCPPAFLPHLAAAWSVDFWNPDWDDAKKRSIIRQAIRHHRLKGTLEGMRVYARIADAEVLGVIRAPMKFFASGSVSPAGRLAWLESLPQVRIYRSVAFNTKRPTIIAGGATKSFFLSRRFAIPTLAQTRSRPRAVLVKDGVETVVGVRTDFDGYRTVILRRSAGRGAFAGRLAGSFCLPSTAPQTVARISADDMAADPAFARPLRPAGTGNGIYPRFSSDPRSIGRGWFARALSLRRFAAASSARTRMFEQIPIADGTAPPEPGAPTAFATYTRLGIPPHTAELKVSMPGKGAKVGFFAGGRPAGSFAIKVDKTRIEVAFEAMRAARALADKVLIDSRTYRNFEAGPSFFAGQDIFAGQMTRS